MEDAPCHIYDKSVSPPRIRAAFEGFWDCLNKSVAQSQHNGDFRWSTLPKQHMQMHMVDDVLVDVLDVIYSQGYTDEDIMRWVVSVARGAHRGHLSPQTRER